MSTLRNSSAYVEAVDLSCDLEIALKRLTDAKDLNAAQVEVRPLLIAALGKWLGVEAAIKLEPSPRLADIGTFNPPNARRFHWPLPPISGGSPEADDSWEEMDPAAFDESWPAYPDALVDGYRYEMGPTPVEILAADAPTWEPTDADWADLHAADGYDAWLDSLAAERHCEPAGSIFGHMA